MSSLTNPVKHCAFCGAPLSPGRTDKRYCDDVCRNNHRYALVGRRSSLMCKINAQLARNHKILSSLLTSKTKVDKISLVKNDFDFSCFTGVHKTHQGREYIIVYDIAYCVLNDETVKIIKFCNEND